MHSGTTNAREAEQYGPYQRSELFMYKISILIESGDNQAALDAMTKHEPIIVDKQGLRELRAEVLLKVGKAAEAESLYRELLKLNPENKNYHIGLQNSLGLYPESGKQLSDDQTQKLVTLYAELQAAYPKAYLVQQFPLLHFLSGDAFSAAFIKYARPQLVKGTPSLFNSIKPLYTQADKVQAIEKALLTALESLKKSKKFAPADAEEADPSVELWVLFFLAQHYNKLQQFNKALEYIEDAIKHSPTLIDLYLIKARIHKHAGNYVDASNLTEKAREMDLADRYLNNKSTLYLLRANRVEEARKTISIFTKVDPETFNNVFDMQVMWYEQEEGESHLRTGNYGAALKKFTNIEAHFRCVFSFF
jgi:peptide alpha-N-acetyltransferase